MNNSNRLKARVTRPTLKERQSRPTSGFLHAPRLVSPRTRSCNPGFETRAMKNRIMNKNGVPGQHIGEKTARPTRLARMNGGQVFQKPPCPTSELHPKICIPAPTLNVDVRDERLQVFLCPHLLDAGRGESTTKLTRAQRPGHHDRSRGRAEERQHAPSGSSRR